jgi:hypothetical protein
MKETYGAQQTDQWLKWRNGRITASRMVDVCDRLTRKSGAKNKGDYGGERDTYFYQLAYERQSGRTASHAPTYWMDRGIELEEEARINYSAMVDEPVDKVGFVIHPTLDFFGASLDSLVGAKGGLEIKCFAGPKHLKIIDKGEDPKDLIAQIGGEMMCSQREWIDKFLYCPDLISTNSPRCFRQRFTVDNLVWIGFDGEILKGQAVLDYFESAVKALHADLQNYMKLYEIEPVAPYEPIYKADGKLAVEGEVEKPDYGEVGFTDADWEHTMGPTPWGPTV